jgi:hypothetical protein
VSRNIIFDENTFWSWDGYNTDEQGGEPFTVEYLITEPGKGGAPDGAASTPAPSLAPTPAPSPRTHAPVHASPLTLTPPPAEQPVEFMTLRTLDSNLDSDDEGAAMYMLIDDLMKVTQRVETCEVEQAEVHAISVDELHTFAEEIGNPCWKKAMEEEMESITDNKTWSMEELPAGHRAIGLKWVFKLKRNEDGQVAKGYVQKEGIDFSEVFTLVVRLESARLLLAIAVHHSWEVHHMDVKLAFLNGELKEVVYVQQPLGFINDNNLGKVLRLHKALYGLRQAPWAWNAKLDSTLLSLSFKCCISKHGIYTHGNTERRLIIGVCVDDLIIIWSNVHVLSSFKKEMCKSFKMSDLNALSYYLGVEV